MKKLIELARYIFGSRHEKGNQAEWTEEYCVGFLNAIEMISAKLDGPDAPKDRTEFRILLQQIFDKYACDLKAMREDH